MDGTEKRHLVWRRVWWLFAAPNLFFMSMLGALGSSALINLFDAAIVGLAAAAMVAYHRPVFDALSGKEPLDPGDFLAFGIFLGWFGNLIIRIWSTVWRLAGRPDSWETSPTIAYALFVYACAGVFHLAAKGAIGRRRVPTERWIWIGVLVGICVFISVGIGYTLEWLGLIRVRQ